jgi:hypothetical protein
MAAATAGTRSNEFQAIALERWENEGGRVNKPDGVTSVHSLMATD